MQGIININKPIGFTSNDVVIKLKRIIGIKRIGHLGTLDPMATGVLPICLGKATRLFDYYLKKDKTYKTIFEFGKQTDTFDLEGEITSISDNIPSKTAVLRALNAFVGNIEQIPPKYSAKKINGKKAYELARLGKEFELKSKKVNISEFELISQINNKTFEFLITCSSGTYIRSLCRDLAAKLNSVAVMTSLTRIRCGEFSIKNSLNIEGLTKETILTNLLTIDVALKDLSKYILNDDEFFKITNGVSIEYKNTDNKLLLFYNDEVVGIGCINDNKLKIETFLKE